jgi:hypothetical protein
VYARGKGSVKRKGVNSTGCGSGWSTDQVNFTPTGFGNRYFYQLVVGNSGLVLLA